MNTNTQHNLAELFGVDEQKSANTEVTVFEGSPLMSQEGENSHQAKEDFNKARSNILKLLEHGDDIMAELLDLSTRSQDSKMYDVLVKLMKTLSETNIELVDLQGKKHMVAFDEPKVINNNLFITTDELLQKIKDGRKKLKEQEQITDGT